MAFLAEYIWIDGTKPSAQLRSKTKVVADDVLVEVNGSLTLLPENLPDWGADGSSTLQAEGSDSDIGLKPVRVVNDPFRSGSYLVLCEVFCADGSVHPSNKRAELRDVLSKGADKVGGLFGFEQEYTFLTEEGAPLGFPENGYPEPQGPYYCAVGAGKIFGREIYEEFLQAALASDLLLFGANWEVMPGQAEYQIGAGDGLTTSDHIWLARFLMERIAEDYGVKVTLDAKPAKGDWNGAGMHVNFSTEKMRKPGGMKEIERACVAIGEKRIAHLAVYGDGFEDRLTGAHETCSHEEFRFGVADRTASIRIPRAVATKGYGYFEDRRPNANADPYRVASRLLMTVCDID
jgi:glutamine synthetase